MTGIVVVGAGQAGSSLVSKLRTSGYDGALTLVGAEPVPPYQRPPLSKGYLLGEMALERLFLRPTSYYEDAGITLKLGHPVNGIDRAARKIHVGDETLDYDQLALTTGSRALTLPKSLGGDLPGVFTVRTLADIDALEPAMKPGKRVLIVGGGYIGLEAAAVASKLGLNVTLVEMADRILQRVACPETSAYFRDLHLSHGVDLREGVGLARLSGDNAVSEAELSDGTVLPVDVVVVGIGIAPETALADAAGLTIENGIAVDALGRTSDPAIWSAGDCTSFPYKDGRLRLESVQNAIDQAEAIAANMLGAEAPYVPQPWFWSDQFDVKLQIAGLHAGYDRIVVRPGEKPGSVSHWYFGGTRLVAVDAMNESRAYMVGKRLIESGKSAEPGAVADPQTDLKALLRAA